MSFIQAIKRADIVVHADLGGRLYCEDRPTPRNAHETFGDLFVQCPICFGRNAKVPENATFVKERV